MGMAELDDRSKRYLEERAKAEVLGALTPDDAIPLAFRITREDIDREKLLWTEYKLRQDAIFPRLAQPLDSNP